MPARSKSFTGCWTCRSRKIKCDLGQPECKNCLKANIKCQGYSIKLRWTDEGADPGNDRRTVEFVRFPKSMVYETYQDLDDELNTLVSKTLKPDETAMAGPFGVFQGVEVKPVKLKEPVKRKRERSVTSPVEKRPVKSRDQSPRSNSQTPLNQAVSTPSAVSSTRSQEKQIIQPLVQSQFIEDPVFMIGSAGSAVSGLGPFSYDPAPGMEGIEEDLLSFFPPNYIEAESVTTTNDVLFEAVQPGIASNIPPGEVFSLGNSPTLVAQARFLLWHYKQHVTPIMTFVIHPKNPWRTIYLPRAYAAIGDIVVTGETSNERYTLLYTFSAISAYHIRNKFNTDTQMYTYYNDMAVKLQNEAKSWLSRTLHSETTGKYKDLLVALLSMITLDLLRGQESTVEAPLGAAQRLINLRYSRRPKLSRKAMILHRICVMLTLLQKSTVVADSSDLGVDTNEEGDATDAWMDRTFEDVVHPQTKRLALKELEKLESRQMPLSYMNDELQLEEYFNQYQNFGISFAEEPTTLPNDYEAVSTQLIHGVPDSLVYVFKQVVDVSRRALLHREATGALGPKLSSQCTQVEAQLASWKSQFETTKPTDLLVPQVNEAVMHHSLAVHEALVVYHYRMAKDVNRSLLQPVVERVLEHLEAISRMNSEIASTTPIALPFLFAGFICGCEIVAENQALRERYDAWFNDLRSCGLSTYETAIGVLEEVNRRRQAGKTSNWWDVVREQGVTLVMI